MADVAISELTRGVPAGNALIPYSTGSSTLGTSVSAILQNTNNVGIGVNGSVYGNNLILRGSDSSTFIGKLPLGLGILNGGTYDLAGIDFKNITGNSLAGRIGVEVTSGGGTMKFGTSNDYATGITNTALTIDPSGNVDATGPSLRTKGYNHIEYAMVGPTQTSIDSIIAAESGYLNFDTTTNIENTMRISNSAVFELIPTGNYGMKILKTGNLKIDYVQDIVTTAKPAYVLNTQNYIGCHVSVNGVIRARTLMRHTDGIWSQITGACTLQVNANDAITFYLYSATPGNIKISRMDARGWSYFSFMFWS